MNKEIQVILDELDEQLDKLYYQAAQITPNVISLRSIWNELRVIRARINSLKKEPE